MAIREPNWSREQLQSGAIITHWHDRCGIQARSPASPEAAIHEEIPSSPLHQNRLIRRLVKLIVELDLDQRDFVIFGSGPLLAHGLRQHLNDLDIVARGTTWDRVEQYGIPTIGLINNAPMVQFWGGLIEFSQGWISKDWNADDLIDHAEIIQGLPFAQLADVLAYKQSLDRPKDGLDIKDLLCLLNPSCPDGGPPRPDGVRRRLS